MVVQESSWFDRNLPWLVTMWAVSRPAPAAVAAPVKQPPECVPNIPLEQQKGCVTPTASAPPVKTDTQAKPQAAPQAEKATVMQQGRSSGNQPQSTW
nr:hypothetical protein [Oxalobacteraceae bacterium]